MAQSNPNPPAADVITTEGLSRLPVGFYGTLGIVSCTVLFVVWLLYSLLAFWPEKPNRTAPSGEQTRIAANTTPGPQDTNGGSQDTTARPIDYFGGKIDLGPEARLLALVIFAGALGGTIHSLRSLSWYIGNRELVWSWVVMYAFLPMVGGCLALVFYLTIRGGFFSPDARTRDASPFGFVAMASLVGLFTQQAVEKLKTVAETVFTRAESGKDKATTPKTDAG